jgi:RNA polymerase sigma-70 factor (ECF subfamily)
MASDPLRFGVLLWPQYTDWPSLMRAGARADQLGYDSPWTWDHLYPIVGSPTRAEILRDLGRSEEAKDADKKALQLTANPAERALLEQRLL